MNRVYGLAAPLLASALMFGTAGCASAPPAGAWTPELAPSTVEPTNDAEAQVLLRAPGLPVDEAVQVAGLTVVASEPYAAASGRVCRELRMSDQARLACDSPGGWVFVPVLVEGP